MIGPQPPVPLCPLLLHTQLLPVNAFLHRYSEWYRFIHKWMVIQVEDVQWVFNWRLQAEVAMRAKGKAGMTDEEVSGCVVMGSAQGRTKGVVRISRASGCW